jgi:hypothetical protein
MSYDLFHELAERLAKNKKGFMPPIPAAVTTFLGELSLLKGVPLYNLIPSERYLPLNVFGLLKQRGSLKFFWLDPEWIESLLNGALSIADESTRTMLDNAMDGKYIAQVFYNEALEKAKRQIGLNATGEAYEELLKSNLKAKKIEFNKPKPTIAQTNWRYTGFFIRSSIITAWTTVEIIPYGDTDGKGEDNRLQLIRLERIAPDTIYCICEGVINRIEIIQPPETIHFDISAYPGIAKRPHADAEGVIDIKKFVDGENAKRKPEDKQPLLNSALVAAKLLGKSFKSTLTINRK